MVNIPASYVVSVNPSVLSAGGTAMDLNGLILTNSTRVPVGQVLPLSSTLAVQNYFGPVSDEAVKAAVYFNGFDNSNKKPGNLLFAQYPAGPVAAWLRGGNISGLSLTALKALTGVLTVTVDGVVKTSSAIVLTAATSFSSAATIILAAFTTPGFTFVYDSIAGAFLLTSSTTGVTSTVSIGSGTIAAGLMLTTATGAVLSQGAIAGVPATNMAAIVAQTTNWCSLMTLFEPILSDKILFATWVSSTANAYLYVCWDTDVTATQAGNTTCFGYLIGQGSYSGVAAVYQDPLVAAFLLGAIASIDFTQTEGRITLKFKSQAGLSPTVTDATTMTNLKANGYNMYSAYGTANQQFVFFDPGSVSGAYKWIDAYVDQIWLNSQLQLANMVAFTSVKRVPYNAAGRAFLEQVALDPINQALNCGVIVRGVTLSASQAAQANNAAGIKIDDTLFQRGWYYQVKDALPQVRAARGTPPVTLWYTDGGAVHALAISSVEVQ